MGSSKEIKLNFMSPDRVRQHFRDPRAVEHYEQAAASVGLWLSEETVFRQVFNPEEKLLDLGCGAGRIAIGLWYLGYKNLTGADYSWEMIEGARRLADLMAVSIPFHLADATALQFTSGSFDGVIFGFNGMMQIPGRERRREAMKEVLRVIRPGGSFVFTTHDRANMRHRAFWIAEEERWKNGEQDSRLVEFGDRYYEAPIGCTFMHVPSREEVLEDLALTGWEPVQDFRRSQVAKEPARVREFSDECRFWIARKPETREEESEEV